VTVRSKPKLGSEHPDIRENPLAPSPKTPRRTSIYRRREDAKNQCVDDTTLFTQIEFVRRIDWLQNFRYLLQVARDCLQPVASRINDPLGIIIAGSWHFPPLPVNHLPSSEGVYEIKPQSNPETKPRFSRFSRLGGVTFDSAISCVFETSSHPQSTGATRRTHVVCGFDTALPATVVVAEHAIKKLLPRSFFRYLWVGRTSACWRVLFLGLFRYSLVLYCCRIACSY